MESTRLGCDRDESGARSRLRRRSRSRVRAHVLVCGAGPRRMHPRWISDRLLRRPPCRPITEPRARRTGAAVLDQLPDADVGLDQPAATRRIRQPHPAVVADPRRAAQLARRRLADTGHRAGLRLRTVLHPAAVLGPRTHRRAAHRGRSRPRRIAAQYVHSNHLAVVGAGTDGSERHHGAADVR